MTGIGGIAGNAGAHPAPDSDSKRLEQAPHELEGVFLAQLFRAMRETVDEEEGIFGASAENDTFSAMFDDTLAQMAAQKLHGGLGDAIYRQLSRQLAEFSGSERE
jgi:flagellar protein FlgJ